MTAGSNEEEGADPGADIKAQNAGETTTADQVDRDDDDAGEGDNEESGKTQDLAKAGRRDFDPNEGSD